MSNPKFTPGPWKVSGVEGCRMIVVNRECSEQTVIADVWGKGERHEANAALIAAAPEMYRDLREAAHEFCFNCREADDREISDDCGTVCPAPQSECFVRRWIETLKKARG